MRFETLSCACQRSIKLRLQLAVWVRAGEGLSHDVRRVLAALSAVVFAYVWIAQWQGSGWSLARHSILLPVLVAAVGVACLFLSARHQQRHEAPRVSRRPVGLSQTVTA